MADAGRESQGGESAATISSKRLDRGHADTGGYTLGGWARRHNRCGTGPWRMFETHTSIDRSGEMSCVHPPTYLWVKPVLVLDQRCLFFVL